MSSGIKLGYAEVKRTTEKAVLFDTANYGEVWVPQSQVHADSEVWDSSNPSGELVVREWWARKNGYL